jgi:mono/diheme cytochrome c family protein
MPKKNESDQTSDSALAKAIEGLGELPASYRIEEISEHLASLASELRSLAHASAMSIIAQYGTDEDRAAVVKYLKHHFERGTFEEE